MSKFILFYWSKGAEMRVKILNEIHKCGKAKKPCYLNQIAEKLGVSHVAVKKHLDLLVDEGYVKEINPEGKPVYLNLTKEGVNILADFRKK